MTHVCPHITVLDPEQRESVHRYSLDILSKIGVRVDEKSARNVLIKGGCKALDGRRVTIPAVAVAQAVNAAPSAVTVYGRNGSPAFTVGENPPSRTRFGIGVTNLYYQDPMTDAVTPFTLDHTKSATRLGHGLNQFDMVSTPGVVRDLSPDIADLRATLVMAANTDKPLVILVSETGLFEPVFDLVFHLFPDSISHPFALAYVNPVTPLVLNAETTDKMTVAVNRGIPLIINNYGMSGASAPITPGGTLALLNAELLAGLVFSQLLRPGAEVLLGSLSAGFDMKTTESLYTPHTMLLNLASAEMMNHYGLPHSGTSGSGPGWGPDLAAAGGLWMNHITACMGKVGLAPCVGGNFDSLAFSPATVVYANEVIREARQISEGFDLDDASTALDEMAETGPGGSFLSAGMTLKEFREEPYKSSIRPSLTLNKWREQNSPRAENMLRQYTIDLLNNLSAPEDHDAVMERGEAFIRKRF